MVRLDAATRRVVVGPREALRTRRIALRDVNWIGDGALDEALAAGRLEVFVKVRSTRPPQRGLAVARRTAASRSNWSMARTASRPARPACSTTRAEGQARVLGGGFIQRSAVDDARGAHAAHADRYRSRAS